MRGSPGLDSQASATAYRHRGTPRSGEGPGVCYRISGTRGGAHRVVADGERLWRSGRRADLPAEVDLPELVRPGQVTAGLQVMQAGEQIDRAGRGVTLADERPVTAAGLPQIPGRAAERRGGHDRPGRGLAVVVHPEHDFLVQAVEPDVVHRLGVGARH